MTWRVSSRLIMKPERNCKVSPPIATYLLLLSFPPTLLSVPPCITSQINHWHLIYFRLCLLGNTETGIRWSRVKGFQSFVNTGCGRTHVRTVETFSSSYVPTWEREWRQLVGLTQVWITERWSSMKEILGCCVSLADVDGLDFYHVYRVKYGRRQRTGGVRTKTQQRYWGRAKTYLINREGIRNFPENKICWIFLQNLSKHMYKSNYISLPFFFVLILL